MRAPSVLLKMSDAAIFSGGQICPLKVSEETSQSREFIPVS